MKPGFTTKQVIHQFIIVFYICSHLQSQLLDTNDQVHTLFRKQSNILCVQIQLLIQSIVVQYIWSTSAITYCVSVYNNWCTLHNWHSFKGLKDKINNKYFAKSCFFRKLMEDIIQKVSATLNTKLFTWSSHISVFNKTTLLLLNLHEDSIVTVFKTFRTFLRDRAWSGHSIYVGIFRY